MRFKAMKECLADMLPSYLELLWREPQSKTASEAFSSIIEDIEDIAQRYPV